MLSLFLFVGISWFYFSISLKLNSHMDQGYYLTFIFGCLSCVFWYAGQTCSQNLNALNMTLTPRLKIFQMLVHTCWSCRKSAPGRCSTSNLFHSSFWIVCPHLSSCTPYINKSNSKILEVSPCNILNVIVKQLFENCFILYLSSCFPLCPAIVCNILVLLKAVFSYSSVCDISCRRGLTDELGAEAMMFEALEKVEKDIKKPLLRSDKKGMDLLVAEFEKGNKKYVIILQPPIQNKNKSQYIDLHIL